MRDSATIFGIELKNFVKYHSCKKEIMHKWIIPTVAGAAIGGIALYMVQRQTGKYIPAPKTVTS